MAYSLTVAGVEHIEHTVIASLTVRHAIELRGTTMDVTFRHATTDPSLPLVGNIIKWLDGTTKEFEGIIVNVTTQRIPGASGNADVIYHHCRCIDYVFLLDRILTKAVYAIGQAADVTATQIIQTFTTGFTTINLQSGAPGLPQQVFDYVPVSDALTQIARAAGWGWYIDFNRDIHFFPTEANLGPVNPVDLDNDAITVLGYEGLEQSIEQIRNRVFLKDFKILLSNPYTESLKADGTGRYFALHMEPSVNLSDVTVLLGGGAQHLLFDFLDGQPGDGLTASGTAYFCQTNWGIRFPDGNTPSAGTQLDFTYSAYAPENLYQVDDIGSQAYLQSALGELGVFEYLHNANDLRVPNYDPIEYQGRIVLSLYAPVFKQVIFKTQVKGWLAGQNIEVKSAVNNFDQLMYITSVTKKMLTGNNPQGATVTEYTVTCQSKPDVYL